jgi:hypothetical protein
MQVRPGRRLFCLLAAQSPRSTRQAGFATATLPTGFPRARPRGCTSSTLCARGKHPDKRRCACATISSMQSIYRGYTYANTPHTAACGQPDTGGSCHTHPRRIRARARHVPDEWWLSACMLLLYAQSSDQPCWLPWHRPPAGTEVEEALGTHPVYSHLLNWELRSGLKYAWCMTMGGVALCKHGYTLWWLQLCCCGWLALSTMGRGFRLSCIMICHSFYVLGTLLGCSPWAAAGTRATVVSDGCIWLA